ncbi:hypothetical protein D3C85_1804090 [compost metagenome]
MKRKKGQGIRMVLTIKIRRQPTEPHQLVRKPGYQTAQSKGRDQQAGQLHSTEMSKPKHNKKNKREKHDHRQMKAQPQTIK